jgi:hypothetical protein
MAEVPWGTLAQLQGSALSTERKLVCTAASYQKVKIEKDREIGSNAQEDLIKAELGTKRNKKEKKISGEIRSEKVKRY